MQRGRIPVHRESKGERGRPENVPSRIKAPQMAGLMAAVQFRVPVLAIGSTHHLVEDLRSSELLAKPRPPRLKDVLQMK
jgi:hypothetical protein